MRAVEDHHVDRPDVDAQQWVKLTGPNRSIGLIQPTHPAQRQAPKGTAMGKHATTTPTRTRQDSKKTENRRQNRGDIRSLTSVL